MPTREELSTSSGLSDISTQSTNSTGTKPTLGLCAWLFSISTKVSNLQLQRFNPALISLRFGNSQSEFEFFK